MRLVATVPFPVVSVVVLSLGVSASLLAPPSLSPMTPPCAEIESVERVLQREQVRVQREAVPHHSVWRGTYVCAQGESAMTLTIDIESDGTARARYDFGATESNPTVPTGAFLLAGSIRHDGNGGFGGTLDATQWIVHPDNYFMEALTVRSPDGRRLIGKTHHESCMEFEIERVE
jgi:hypothetical protein